MAKVRKRTKTKYLPQFAPMHISVRGNPMGKDGGYLEALPILRVTQMPDGLVIDVIGEYPKGNK